MGRKPRASISVSGELFKKLEAEAKRRDIPISRLVELACADVIGLDPDEDIKPDDIH